MNWRMLSLFAALMSSSVPSLAAGLKVIANPSLLADSITVAELKSLYLQEQRSIHGSPIELVLAKRGSAHEIFLKQYIGKTDDALGTYYRTLVFTGTGTMPKFMDSDAAIVNYVARTKGSIGYVDLDVPDAGVKVLTVRQAGDNPDRKLISRVAPDYPETLQRMQIGGIVRLTVEISPKGAVDSVHVLGGNPILARSRRQSGKAVALYSRPSAHDPGGQHPFRSSLLTLIIDSAPCWMPLQQQTV